MISVSIIGLGRVGGALALALPGNKYRINDLVGKREGTFDLNGVDRSIRSLNDINGFDSDVVFITTPDSLISDISRRIVGRIKPGSVVFHTSGAISSLVLQGDVPRPYKIGSIHPLISISTPVLGVERMRGAFFCVEGDPDAIILAQDLVRDLGGVPFEVNTDKKPIYHAAAVMASGHLIALFDIAVELMAIAGPDPETAKKLLLSLTESSIKNLRDQENSQALTGTFARADVRTFESHVQSIRENSSSEILEIYLDLGLRSLELALRQGTERSSVGRIRELINVAKSIPR